MARRLNVYVMWNGVWEVVGGRHSYTGDDIQAKQFPLMHGATVQDLKGEVVKRMTEHYDGRPIELRHMRSGVDQDRYPPVKIDNEQDLNDLFDIYDLTDVVALYVTLRNENPAELGGQQHEKMVPRKGNTCGPEDAFEICELESFESVPPSSECIGDYDFRELDTDGCKTFHPNGMELAVAGSVKGEDDGHNETLGDEYFGTSGTYTESTLPAVERENSRPDGADIAVGNVFQSAGELTEKLTAAATRCGWQYRVKKRDATRLIFKCDDPECNWHAGAYKNKEGTHYTLKKHNNIHTCSAMSLDLKHRNVTSKVLARGLLTRFSDPTTPPSVREIMAYSSGTMHSKCTPWKAYSTRKVWLDMLAGPREENHRDLPAAEPLVKTKRTKRPTDARTPSEGVRFGPKRMYKCGKCGQFGHNQATCPGNVG